MEISGSLALVTGASGGMGAALAKELAQTGASVVLLARRKAQLDHVAADITSLGGKAWTYSVDLTKAEAVALVAASIIEVLGIPNILVNTQGLAHGVSRMKSVPLRRSNLWLCRILRPSRRACFSAVYAETEKRPHCQCQFRGIALRMAGQLSHHA